MDEAVIVPDREGWFIVINHDRCDAEGNWGMDSEIVGNAKGYRSWHAALDALRELRGN